MEAVGNGFVLRACSRFPPTLDIPWDVACEAKKSQGLPVRTGDGLNESYSSFVRTVRKDAPAAAASLGS